MNKPTHIDILAKSVIFDNKKIWFILDNKLSYELENLQYGFIINNREKILAKDYPIGYNLYLENDQIVLKAHQEQVNLPVYATRIRDMVFGPIWKIMIPEHEYNGFQYFIKINNECLSVLDFLGDNFFLCREGKKYYVSNSKGLICCQNNFKFLDSKPHKVNRNTIEFSPFDIISEKQKTKLFSLIDKNIDEKELLLVTLYKNFSKYEEPNIILSSLDNDLAADFHRYKLKIKQLNSYKFDKNNPCLIVLLNKDIQLAADNYRKMSILNSKKFIFTEELWQDNSYIKKLSQHIDYEEADNYVYNTTNQDILKYYKMTAKIIHPDLNFSNTRYNDLMKKLNEYKENNDLENIIKMYEDLK